MKNITTEGDGGPSI